mmetsp:Transcript_10122/g.24164  ORF Transcript_10122/g.24164 Transcript_10122/m.24164 type:complete len:328 (+) Transcript_10122:415-1398(+)
MSIKRIIDIIMKAAPALVVALFAAIFRGLFNRVKVITKSVHDATNNAIGALSGFAVAVTETIQTAIDAIQMLPKTVALIGAAMVGNASIIQVKNIPIFALPMSETYLQLVLRSPRDLILRASREMVLRATREIILKELILASDRAIFKLLLTAAAGGHKSAGNNTTACTFSQAWIQSLEILKWLQAMIRRVAARASALLFAAVTIIGREYKLYFRTIYCAVFESLFSSSTVSSLVSMMVKKLFSSFSFSFWATIQWMGASIGRMYTRVIALLFAAVNIFDCILNGALKPFFSMTDYPDVIEPPYSDSLTVNPFLKKAGLCDVYVPIF